MFLLHDQRGDAERARKSAHRPSSSRGSSLARRRHRRLSPPRQDSGTRAKGPRGVWAYERAWRWEFARTRETRAQACVRARIHVHTRDRKLRPRSLTRGNRRSARNTVVRWVRRYLNALHTESPAAVPSPSRPSSSRHFHPPSTRLRSCRAVPRAVATPLLGRPHQHALC